MKYKTGKCSECGKNLDSNSSEYLNNMCFGCYDKSCGFPFANKSNQWEKKQNAN